MTPDPGTWVRVAHCQSTCGRSGDIALGGRLREAERKGLGEESARFGYRGAHYYIPGITSDLLVFASLSSATYTQPRRAVRPDHNS